MHNIGGTINIITKPVNPVHAVKDPKSCMHAAAIIGGVADSMRKIATLNLSLQKDLYNVGP